MCIYGQFFWCVYNLQLLQKRSLKSIVGEMSSKYEIIFVKFRTFETPVFYKLISAGGVGWLNQQLLTIRHYYEQYLPWRAGGVIPFIKSIWSLICCV